LSARSEVTTRRYLTKIVECHLEREYESLVAIARVLH